jgi:hypothetical protein
MVFNFNFSYLVNIFGSSPFLNFPGPGPAPGIKRVQLELEFGLEVEELHLSVNLGMQYLVYVQYRGKGINIEGVGRLRRRCCIKYRGMEGGIEE